eukprot:462744_1
MQWITYRYILNLPHLTHLSTPKQTLIIPQIRINYIAIHARSILIPCASLSSSSDCVMAVIIWYLMTSNVSKSMAEYLVFPMVNASSLVDTAPLSSSSEGKPSGAAA